jgi:hypothetical protein
MTPDQVKTLFRDEVADTVRPYLVERRPGRFVSRGRAARVVPQHRRHSRFHLRRRAARAVANGSGWADISPAVLKIIGARLASTGRPLRLYNYDDLYSVQNVQRELPFHTSQIEQAGPVLALVTDVTEGQVKVVQIPQADDTVLLTIDRLPLEDPNTSGELEIRARVSPRAAPAHEGARVRPPRRGHV